MLYPKKLLPWYRNVDLLREGLLTSNDAARFLAISRTKIYDVMSSGDLPYVNRENSENTKGGLTHLRRARLDVVAD